MTRQIKHRRVSKNGKPFIAGSRHVDRSAMKKELKCPYGVRWGVVQTYHVLGEGHSARVVDVGKGKARKEFLGNVNKGMPHLERDREFDNYVRYELWKSPVIVPLKWTPKGLLMPKLSVVTRSSLPHEYRAHGLLSHEGVINDHQLKILWNGLRDLGKRLGVACGDVLHVGIASNGRPYFFDIGGFRKTHTVADAEIENRFYWQSFCEKIGRDDMKELYPEWPTVDELVKELNRGGC